MCKAWHGKSKMSREVIEALMYPILKYPRIKDSNGKPTGEPDYNRYPTMKIKLPFWEGKFNIEIYSMDKKPLYLPNCMSSSPVDVIPKASHINGHIQCTGIWFAGGKCGVTWKLVQACVRPPARLLGTGTCHIEDDSDDEIEDDNLNRKEADESNEEVPTFDDEDNVEEMDDEEEEDQPEPEPAPKKKKKIVRRKKKSSD